MRSKGDEWLRTREACTELGIKDRTLYRMIDEGRLPAFKFGRVIRIRRADLDEFIERQRIEPGSLRHLYPHSNDGDNSRM